MNRFQRSWQLFKSSLTVMQQNKKLLVFPIVISVLMLGIAGEYLGRLSETAEKSPGRYFAVLLIISSIAYIPLASVFKPWYYSQIWGPFSFQPGRLLHYVVYFFAGVGLGACGLEGGLFTSHGILARRWALWLAGAFGTFLLWMLVTALSPVIGYDNASQIAHYALDNDLTLKEAALRLGLVTEGEFDRVVDPIKMVQPYVAKAR